jgi:hypothetical protein
MTTYIKGLNRLPLTEEQKRTAKAAAGGVSVSQAEVWIDEGAQHVAYFDDEGNLVGDWVC